MNSKRKSSIDNVSPAQNHERVSNGDSMSSSNLSGANAPEIVFKYGDDSDPLFIQEQSFGSDNENGVDAEGSDGGSASLKTNPKWPLRADRLFKFVCAKCGMEFGKETYIKQHLENFHSELHTAKNLKFIVTSPTEGECQICGAHVMHRTVRDLQAHYFMHLPYKSYKCKCHNYSFNDKETGLKHLKFHAQQSMARKVQTYQETESDMARKVQVQQETESISSEGCRLLEDGTAYDPQYPETAIRYLCPECGQSFVIEDEWKEHCNSEHDFKTMEGLNMTKLDGIQVLCNECNTIIASKSDNYKLRRHKVTHSPFKAYHCKLCIYGRKRKEDVLQHIRHSHVREGEKYY